MFLLLMCFNINTASAQKQQTDPKGSLFIIGGGSRPPAMVDRIIKESGIDKKGYGIILPMASSEQDSAVYYAKKQFSEAGMNNVFGILISEEHPVTTQKIDSIKKAALIYISGGDQDRFMKIVEGTPVASAIHENYRNGGMIAGTSAGAAVMSKEMITGTELKHPEYHSTFRNLEENNLELKEGLGMLKNTIIDQHFVKRSRYNRLLNAIIENPETKGIGIDESTAILVKGKDIEVVGESQVIVFSNPKASKKVSQGKLSAKGIVIDIYLNGDTFKL